MRHRSDGATIDRGYVTTTKRPKTPHSIGSIVSWTKSRRLRPQQPYTDWTGRWLMWPSQLQTDLAD